MKIYADNRRIRYKIDLIMKNFFIILITKIINIFLKIAKKNGGNLLRETSL